MAIIIIIIIIRKSKKKGLKGSNQLFSLYQSRSCEMYLPLVEILQHNYNAYCPVDLIN